MTEYERLIFYSKRRGYIATLSASSSSTTVVKLPDRALYMHKHTSPKSDRMIPKGYSGTRRGTPYPPRNQ